MRLAANTSARADAMVAACGLDSASIFFCDRRRPTARLSYLHHYGVSQEAQHIYQHERVFDEDPFTRVAESADRAGRMIRWGATTLSGAADTAVNYRYFLNRYSVDVIGAFVQQVLPNLFLVLGAHCSPGLHRSVDVSHRLLEYEIEALAGMVVAQLLDETLTSAAGHHLVDAMLDPDAHAPTDRSTVQLSRREQEIADLVCAGKQNKQIAFDLGLSEFTVENHLRRIYRKLGVHNRTGMANARLRAPTFQ